MRHWARRIAFAALGLVAGATARAETARELLDQGKTSFGLAQLDESRQALERARAATRDPLLLGQIHLYLGFNDAVIGATGRARDEIRRALSYDPTLAIDTRDLKQELVGLFMEVRRSLGGELQVATTDPPARVFVDGEERGVAPYTGTLPIGTHTVEVRGPGELSRFATTVIIGPGKATRVVARLEPAQGLLDVSTTPAGAVLLLDGRRLGTSPLRGERVAAGPHEIVALLPGHAAGVRRFHVGPRGRAEVRVALDPVAAPITARPERVARRWTWVAAGGALALLGSAIAVGASASADYADWEDHCRSTVTPACADVERDVRAKDLAANVLFGAAGGAAVAAVLLYVFEGRPTRERPAAAVRAVSRRAAGTWPVVLVGRGAAVRLTF